MLVGCSVLKACLRCKAPRPWGLLCPRQSAFWVGARCLKSTPFLILLVWF
uniref:Uncharacterized protein n=1 Tax=Rhizophora mucronata TaxID=61149 RepID=A0A2P2Q5X4_RHIMU